MPPVWFGLISQMDPCKIWVLGLNGHKLPLPHKDMLQKCLSTEMLSTHSDRCSFQCRSSKKLSMYINHFIYIYPSLSGVGNVFVTFTPLIFGTIQWDNYCSVDEETQEDQQNSNERKTCYKHDICHSFISLPSMAEKEHGGHWPGALVPFLWVALDPQGKPDLPLEDIQKNLVNEISPEIGHRKYLLNK